MHATLLIMHLLLILCVSALWFYCYAIYAATDLFSRPTRVDRDFHPPITILKPRRGLDSEAHANLASFCQQDYPRYQIILGSGCGSYRCVTSWASLCGAAVSPATRSPGAAAASKSAKAASYYHSTASSLPLLSSRCKGVSMLRYNAWPLHRREPAGFAARHTATDHGVRAGRLPRRESSHAER
jgi:hypothetical protein